MIDPEAERGWPGAEPLLREEITDSQGTYVREWYTEPPPLGAGFSIMQADWAGDVQRVWKIHLWEGSR